MHFWLMDTEQPSIGIFQEELLVFKKMKYVGEKSFTFKYNSSSLDVVARSAAAIM